MSKFQGFGPFDCQVPRGPIPAPVDPDQKSLEERVAGLVKDLKEEAGTMRESSDPKTQHPLVALMFLLDPEAAGRAAMEGAADTIDILLKKHGF